MIRPRLVPVLWGLAIAARAAVLDFDFSGTVPGALPPGWTNQLSGVGRPGDWQVALDDVPPALEPLSAQAPRLSKRAVIAKTSGSALDEHFPLCVYTGDRFGDFTFTARFRITGGAFEQIAGLVFRQADERNFYVVRASALGGNLRFYKFVGGERSAPIGPSLPFRAGRWYELAVRASGNQIDVLLDGTNVFPTITDSSFTAGRIGFMTKSDSTAQFTDARIDYRPLETLAAALVRQALADQPRLLDLRLLATTTARPELHVVAAKNAADVGKPAGTTDRKVFDENQAYFGRSPGAAIVTAPLHDRNGDVIGVMQFHLKPYPGQIESTTVARVIPTLKRLESGIAGARELTE